MDCTATTPRAFCPARIAPASADKTGQAAKLAAMCLMLWPDSKCPLHWGLGAFGHKQSQALRLFAPTRRGVLKLHASGGGLKQHAAPSHGSAAAKVKVGAVGNETSVEAAEGLKIMTRHQHERTRHGRDSCRFVGP